MKITHPCKSNSVKVEFIFNPSPIPHAPESPIWLHNTSHKYHSILMNLNQIIIHEKETPPCKCNVVRVELTFNASPIPHAPESLILFYNI